MTEHDELALFASRVAVRAGERIAAMRAAKSIEEATKDGGRELVTSADLASNELIQHELMRHTPDAQYFSEEGSQQGVDWTRSVWVVDPIDGTVNYIYGHSHVGIALAYVVGGEVQLGVVHSPFQAETFVAVRDGGARLNGERLVSKPPRPLQSALIATGFPHNHEDLDAILNRLGRVLGRCRDIRRLASPALDICWVAAGRLDAAFETLRPWDVAAAGLIARELSVMRGHFAPPRESLPAEVCGQDVAFARQPLLDELLSVLKAAPV